MTRVTLRHALDCGHCRSGVKAYCEAHGIALADLIGPDAPGIDSAALRAFGDRFALEIADRAEAEEAARG